MLWYLKEHKNTTEYLIKEYNTLSLCMINNYRKRFCYPQNNQTYRITNSIFRK